MNNFWWNSEKGNVHSDVFPLVETIDKQNSREADYRNFIRLYGQTRLYNENAKNTISLTEVNLRGHEDRIKLNVIQSIVDTANTKITKNKPKPMFLTKYGNISLRRRAKNLGDFIESLFIKDDVYEKGSLTFRDAEIFGSGFIMPYRDGDDIKFERIYPGEIFVDPAESLYAYPRSMHRKKPLAKEVLIGLFPEYEAEILSEGEDNRGTTGSKSSERIEVIESWHLPSLTNGEENMGDGRHTICIKNTTLFDDDWDKSYFPPVKIDWVRAVLGFWGIGLPEMLSGLQFEINKLFYRIQQAMHLVSVPRVFIDGSAQVVTGQVSNAVGSIIRYAGKPPVFNTPPSMSGEVFSHLDRLVQRAYEISGISQLNAQSKKPAGLDSGVALREYNDISSERLITAGTSYERMFMDLSKRCIDLAKDIAEDIGEFPVKIVSQDSIHEIDWKEVDLPKEEYHLSIFPVSMLPDTPAGRLQTIQELIGAGFIPREQGLKLIDFPDIQEYTRLETAQTDDIDRVIEMIYDYGADGYSPPETLQNLPLGIKRMQAEYILARLSDIEEDKLELMREWINSATELLVKKQQEAQAQQAQLAQMQQQQQMQQAQMQPEQVNENW